MSEGTRFCWRCDEPIMAGQKFTTAAKVSISAGGYLIRIHEKCPKVPSYVRRTTR